jgi:hypothetical protein
MRTRTLLLLAVVATAGSIWLGVAGVAVVAGVAGGVQGGRPAGDVGGTVSSSSAPGREPEALAVLHRWDRRRSSAWAAGDVGALTRLYVPGSATGRQDVARLRRWTRRGLHVTGLRQQVAAVRVVRSGGRRLVVVATDRTVGARAVGAGRRTALPLGGWATHRISLVRVSGRWRVVEVRAQPAR